MKISFKRHCEERSDTIQENFQYTKSWIASLALAMTIAIASPVQAAFTVYDLKHTCGSKRVEDQVGCRLYILGVADGLDLESRLAGKMHFCVPPGIPTLQLEQVITLAANDDVVAHPQDNKMPAVSFIGAVFAKMFPCQVQVPVPFSKNPILRNYQDAQPDTPSTPATPATVGQSGYAPPSSLTDGYQLVQPPGVPSDTPAATDAPADSQR